MELLALTTLIGMFAFSWKVLIEIGKVEQKEQQKEREMYERRKARGLE